MLGEIYFCGVPGPISIVGTPLLQRRTTSILTANFWTMSPLRTDLCYYVNCGRHRIKDPGISYFRFPVKDRSIAIEWQKRCGNIEIAMREVEDLKEVKLCERHFLERDLLISPQRKLLRRKALPVAYNNEG